MPRSNVLAVLFLVAAVVLSFVGEASRGTRSDEDAPRTPGNAQFAAPITGPVSRATPTQWTEQTARTLAAVEAPSRDLISITQRIKLRGNAGIPASVNSASPDYPVGARQQFYVADLNNKKYNTINATIREVTQHAYWYVKDGYNVDLQALKRTAKRFEENIYPTNRRVFGPEPSPGIDNDPRITILITPISGVNGYFSSADAYPKVVNPFSNQREMMYLSNRPSGNPGDPDNEFEATLAHEFQHMIHWNVHRDRDVWLDEGCSEVAVTLNGYTTGDFDFLFAMQPDTQLNAWSGEPGQSGAHYGASYLFLRYLMHQYGGEQFIAGLVKQRGLGISSIDDAVKEAGSPAGFEGVFKDWLVANTLNNASIAGGRYAYPEGGQAQAARLITRYPATRSESVHQYAADYIKLAGTLGPATVTFKGDSTARVIAANPHGGQAYWYSNRRDSGDAMLTRELDLRRVRKAVLQFWAWYDIEHTFDYAYLNVSTDGGRTWTPQKGKYTTGDNPNGTSFGHAWTGKSGVSAGSKSPARWVQETIDLSAYTGKKALVRFEYITDEGYNAPGFAVDDLRVPETGYSDNVEADNGWNAQGFIRIGNAMPQRWFVALIENGATPRVREIKVNAEGTATIDLEGFGPRKTFRDATLVISALAPKTTETANYSLTVKKK